MAGLRDVDAADSRSSRDNGASNVRDEGRIPVPYEQQNGDTQLFEALCCRRRRFALDVLMTHQPHPIACLVQDQLPHAGRECRLLHRGPNIGASQPRACDANYVIPAAHEKELLIPHAAVEIAAVQEHHDRAAPGAFVEERTPSMAT